MMNLKENSGITLVALVVTIIVLVILAGITINLVAGKEGLVTTAQGIKANIETAEAEGQAKINSLQQAEYTEDGAAIMNDEDAPTINSMEVTDLSSSSFTVKVNVTETGSGLAKIEYSIDDGETYITPKYSQAKSYTFENLEEGIYKVKVRATDSNSNSSYATQTVEIKISNIDGVKIPEGFYYVGGTKDSGLVISDNSADKDKYKDQITVGTDLAGNQFVWIPVTYSNFHLIEGYYNKSLQTNLSEATNPSREAGSNDVTPYLPGKPNASNTTVGTAESKAMYKSVQDNGGFYIARYEAGIANVDTNGDPIDNYSLETKVVATGDVKPLSKAGLGVWNSIAWGGKSSDTASDGLRGSDSADGAVKVARSMYTKSATCGVTSTLCYGVQWDAVMQFLDSNYLAGNCADDSIVKNGTDKGNYSGSLESTGYYAEKNIYDLAGNVDEWTMEAYVSSYRVGRGGDCFGSGSIYPASNRFYSSPDYSYDVVGFRVALYL